MGLHVFGLGIGCVVHVAADVEIVVVGVGDLGLGDEAAVFRQFALVGENEVDLFNVFRAEFVLVFAFGKLPVGIDEEHLVSQVVGLVFIHHQHTGGNARAVKQTGRQTDDGLDNVVVNEQFADKLFLATPKQNAMRHDGCQVPVALQAGQHVLNKHEVGLLARLGTPLAKTRRKLEGGATVVLGKGWIGQHAVELADGGTVKNLGIFQGIAVLNGETGNVVEDHVHDTNRPYRSVGVLAKQGEVVRILPLLLNILVTLYEETARGRKPPDPPVAW